MAFDSANMLYYLDILLKHGNFTKAAKDLYISQPYLTQLIKRTEKELDITIINRQTSPLQLTEAGLFLKTRAEEILQLTQQTSR